MSGQPVMKKPKLEMDEEKEDRNGYESQEERIRDDQEEALLLLVEHRTKEVDHLRQRIAYYNSQLAEAEKRLEETQLKLARLRGRGKKMASKNTLWIGLEEVKVDRRSASPIPVIRGSSDDQFHSTPHLGEELVKLPGYSKVTEKPVCLSNENDGFYQEQTKSKPQLVIPSASVLRSKMKESGNEVPNDSGSGFSVEPPPHDNIVKFKGKTSQRKSTKHHAIEIIPKESKTKLEQKEHKELIPSISSCSSPHTICCHTSSLLSSQHKRKLRTLVLCPTDEQLFLTSALDGVVNLWQVTERGSSAKLLNTTDCQSFKRRWPEDIAWHPHGNGLFSVYTADGEDSQISVLNIGEGREKLNLSFLEEKPHTKGIINSIIFMPWKDTCFATGGSDHAVVFWTEKDDEHSWKPKTLHRSIHSSAVMGVAGLEHKKIVMSAGADKRIIGFDVQTGKVDYQHQIDKKCMSVLPNPCDFNLFMVQTATPECQLRLFDVRDKRTEIHAFGWKQESSESQSALINQSWSPDGLYITSGSADPVIHIFDIRYNAHKPSQSIKAHQKRVFKAVWHHTLPLLISISSDLHIGLHKVTSS